MDVKTGRDFKLLLGWVSLAFIVLVQLEGTSCALVCETSHETYDIQNNFTIKQFKQSVVSVDNEYCSNIGKMIILKNGSAIDAAIAAGLCNGLMNAQSAGIGGGLFMVVYLKDQNKAYGINGREKASQNAFETMFESRSSLLGGLATGIPGEIAGFWEAYKLGGRLPWKTLFEPAIDMCRNGYKASAVLARAIKAYESYIRASDELSDIFINKETNRTFMENEIIKRPRLAYTLERIAESNASAYYAGPLTPVIVEEINANGGNVTLDDFHNYEALVADAESIDITENLTLHTTSVPSGGLVTAFIIQLMQQYNFNSTWFDNAYTKSLFYHRLIEAFKFGFAHRGHLGDENTPEIRAIINNLKDKDYVSDIRSLIDDFKTHPSEYYSTSAGLDDHGTAHVSIVHDGDAVSFTSTVNTYFGAKYAGRYTGIIYNNQMDDFSNPLASNFFGLRPSVENYAKPGKRPMSSMSPLIITDRYTGEPVLVLGASGGSKIITAVAQVVIKTLFMGMNIKDAIDDRRVHHQLYPENAQIEEGFDETMQKMLKLYGHNSDCFQYGGSIIQAVHRVDQSLNGYCDPRKGGLPAGV